MTDAERPEQAPPTTSAAVAMVTSATYLSLGLGLVRGILYTRVLSPTSRGIVQIVFLFGQYLSYSNFGINHGLTKRVPVLLGEGDEGRAQRLEEAGITAVFLSALGAAAVMWAYAAGAVHAGGPTRAAIAIGGVHLIFGQVSGVYRVVLRSRQQFSAIARSTWIESLLLLALVVGGSWLLGAPGTITGWALGMGAVCLYLLSCRALPRAPRLDWAAAGELARVGLPLLGVSLAEIFLRTADNLAIAKLLGAQALGYYGLAWQLALYLYNVPGSAGFVIMPRILQAHGEGGTEAMRRSVLDMTTAFAILMPLLAGLSALAAPVLVRLVLPRYLPAIGPVQFFMIGVVFLALPMALRPVFVAKNRELELIAWQTAGGLLIGGAVVVLIRHGASLTQLALADAAGLSLVSLALVWRGVRLLEVSAARVARYVVGWLVPFVYCASLLWAMKVYLPRWTGSDSPVVNDLTAIPLFVAVGAPLVWVAERTTGIVSKMRARGGPHPPSGEESGTDASTEGSDPSL